MSCGELAQGLVKVNKGVIKFQTDFCIGNIEKEKKKKKKNQCARQGGHPDKELFYCSYGFKKNIPYNNYCCGAQQICGISKIQPHYTCIFLMEIRKTEIFLAKRNGSYQQIPTLIQTKCDILIYSIKPLNTSRLDQIS